MSGVGNPKNVTTFKEGVRWFTFLRSKKKIFEAGVIGSSARADL